MGKILVISDASYSANALGQVNIGGTPESTDVTFYPYGYWQKLNNGSRFVKMTTYSISKYLKVDQSSTLTINYANVGAGCYIVNFFDSNKNYLSQYGVSTVINTPTDINIPSNCAYIIINSRNQSFGSGAQNPSATVTNLKGVEDWEVSPENWQNS